MSKERKTVTFITPDGKTFVIPLSEYLKTALYGVSGVFTNHDGTKIKIGHPKKKRRRPPR